MSRTLVTALLALLGAACLVLVACGGGADEGPTQDTPRVDCRQQPEKCK